MSIQDNRLSTTALSAAFLSPDERDADKLTAYERGGIALNDTSKGLNYQTWIAKVNAARTQISVYPETAPGAAQVVVTDTAISDISLAFDQNMAVAISYFAAGSAKLYWFDTSVQQYVTTAYPANTSQALTMDDKRDAATAQAYNDILFIYVAGGILYYRQQRDRYTIERTLANPAPDSIIDKCGMMQNGRVGVKFKLQIGLIAK